MVLGSRQTTYTDPVLKAAARHVDCVDVHIYDAKTDPRVLGHIHEVQAIIP